jgi:hypothetical protein
VLVEEPAATTKEAQEDKAAMRGKGLREKLMELCRELRNLE